RRFVVHVLPDAASACRRREMGHLLRMRPLDAGRLLRDPMAGPQGHLHRARAMNAHSIAGILAFNLFLLVVGVAVLYGVRGWESWGELLRLSGFAYMLGVAGLGIVFVIELVV